MLCETCDKTYSCCNCLRWEKIDRSVRFIDEPNGLEEIEGEHCMLSTVSQFCSRDEVKLLSLDRDRLGESRDMI